MNPISDDIQGLENSSLYTVGVRVLVVENRSDFLKHMWKNKTFYDHYTYTPFSTTVEVTSNYVDTGIHSIEGTISKFESIMDYATDRYGEDNLDEFLAPFIANDKSSGGSDGLVALLGFIGAYENKEWLYADQKVAVTGSIDENGIVHRVGGIPLKVLTAEKEGADIFILPKEQVEEAYIIVGHKTPLTIVGVESVEETMEWLEENL